MLRPSEQPNIKHDYRYHEMRGTLSPQMIFSRYKAVTLTVTVAITWGALLVEARHPTRAAQPVRPPSAFENPLEAIKVSNAIENIDGRVYLRVNETKLAQSEQWVTVSWSGVLYPTYDDFIALYPDDADIKTVAPIKFKMASSSPSHMALGVGTVQFLLLNMRKSLKFAFIRGGFSAPVVIAWSRRISNDRPNQPTRIHISLTGIPGEVAVQWTTRDKSKLASVQWRAEDSASVVHEVTATSRTYTRADMCGPPANTTGWFDPGWLHYAVLSNLPPNRRIYYRCGNAFNETQDEEWSDENTFRSFPDDGQHSNTPVTILAIADLGQAEVDGSLEMSEMTSSLLTTRALKRHVDDLVLTKSHALLLHNGDISYARGYGTQWDTFYHQISAVVTRIFFMTAIGNHERDWPGSGDRFPSGLGYKDSGGECGVAYAYHTSMPSFFTDTDIKSSEPVKTDVAWYSFDFGPIHFVQYSTEHRFDPQSPQYQFLEADLAGVNKSKTPWVIVGGHRPMYLDSIPWSPIIIDSDQQVAKELREALEPLFIRYGVAATWHGHHHSYQRTCPLIHGKCCRGDAEQGKNHSCGPVHLVIGHAGAELSSNVHLKRPDIFETVQVRHGYLVVQANTTHLVHRAYASDNGQLMDQFTMELGSNGNIASIYASL